MNSVATFMPKQGVTELDSYFPAGLWFDLESHERVHAGTDGRFVTIKAPLDKIPVFARAGSVLVMKPKEVQTTAQR